MIAKVIGWLFILLGIFFLVKPQFLKNKLQKKLYKKLRYYLFTLGFLLSGYLITLGFKFHGIIPKVIMAIGIIGIFKVVFLAKGKAYEKLFDFISRQPLWAFQAFALIYIVLGLLMAYGIKG